MQTNARVVETTALWTAFEHELTSLGLVTSGELQGALQSLTPNVAEASPVDIANALVRKEKLTPYQAQQLQNGRGKELVLGNYVILDKIGEGGMGQVFKARHRRMKRTVAIKMLPRERLRSGSDVERFRREVELVARLDHTNIVTAYDADECGGQHFLAMQYVDGADLASVVGTSGPLNVGQAIAVLMQVASGLAYAHNKGIVHRDLKPGNLLVDHAG